HKLGARVWITRILISWGIVAILTGFVQTVFHLYIFRFLLGVAEAGYFPGIALYLTYWFPQRHLAHAMALLIAAGPVAYLVNAPLSGAILDHVHWFGLSSWRWLLILEGIPAVVGGILTYFLLPGRPVEARFLTVEEKDWITEELGGQEHEKSLAGRIEVHEALVHGRVWHLTAIYFTFSASMYTMVFWMPLLLKGLSSQYSNFGVGILVMIPYLVALAAMLVVAHSSDLTLERRFHAAIPAIIAAVFLLSLATTAISSAFLSVVLWCFVGAGIFSLYGPFWALPNEFLSGFSAAAGIALITYRESRWLCWAFIDGSNQQADRKFSRRVSFRRHFAIRIRNADTHVA